MESAAGTRGEGLSGGKGDVDGLLPRERLVSGLTSAGRHRVVVLEAPAGYGKTTTLDLWDQADRRPFAWVRCEPRHNDPALIFEALAAAIGSTGVDSDLIESLRLPTPDLSVLLDRLDKVISGADAFVLVLDDAHLLESDAAWQVLYTAIFSLPEGSQAAVATRSRPGLPLGRLRARGELYEIAAGDLALTRRESGELLANLDLDLGETANQIFELTEGWPAALYLAGLAIRQGGAQEAVTEFNGSDRMVVEYFHDEFFQEMPENDARFLWRTSILGELNGPLCDAVTGGKDSRLTLDRLAGENVLIVPLDRAGSRYRYHHLFQEMLCSELERREPDLVPDLHYRAAKWLAANGDVPRATDHAISAGDFELAGSLIFLDIADITGRGRVATADRWFGAIGDDRIARVPALALARTHRELAMGQGDESFYWLGVAERLIEKDSPCYGDLLMIKATMGPEGPEGMIRDATRGAELLSPDNPFQAPARLYEGVGYFLTDDDRAEETLRDAVVKAAAVSPLIQSLALSQLALLEVDLGRADDAYTHITRARDQVERAGLGSMGSVALIFAVLAKVLIRNGKSEEAALALERSRRLSAEMVDFIGWYEAELALVNCRTLIRNGQFETAADMISRAEVLVSRLTGASRLERWLAEARSALDRPAAGAMNLTKAELRTLQFLPSHYSFRAIGDQLYLSQNTVKTQANSLYRKLGVNSRAEAVMEGRRLGLLDGEPR